MINMTKHWPGQIAPAPPVWSHLGGLHNHHLDFHRHALQASPPCVVARSPGDQHLSGLRARMAPQQLARTEKRTVSGDSGFSDSTECPGSSFTAAAQELHTKQEPAVQDMRGGEVERSKGGKKKNYQRYPKPPYSYLAMIAMVIQRSPQKKLTLSEILKEISTLFPFFKGNYKGWRDSVRHNLSSYDCFIKVLKDPLKPQGKGNFWTVELSRIPLELLKRQNTAVSRQDETIFAQDLTPYIMKDYKPESGASENPVTSYPPQSSTNPAPLQDDSLQPKLDSSFAIDSLLHSLRPSAPSEDTDMAARNCWAEVEPLKPSPARRPCYAFSAHSASASSVSPASSSSSSSSSALSDDEWRGASGPAKRGVPDGEAQPGAYEGYMAPLHKSSRRETVAPPWELPTSYAKYAPPNAVAPPSMRFSGGPLMALHGGLSLYSYGSPPVTSGHFIGHSYWPLFPSRQVPAPAPPLIMDLDNLLSSVPPNKSVFDALTPASQSSHHPQSQYPMQNGTPLSRYHQF